MLKFALLIALTTTLANASQDQKWFASRGVTAKACVHKLIDRYLALRTKLDGDFGWKNVERIRDVEKGEDGTLFAFTVRNVITKTAVVRGLIRVQMSKKVRTYFCDSRPKLFASDTTIFWLEPFGGGEETRVVGLTPVTDKVVLRTNDQTQRVRFLERALAREKRKLQKLKANRARSRLKTKNAQMGIPIPKLKR